MIKMLFKYLSKILRKNRKKVIYTVIIGDYDELLIPSYVNSNWDYVCFTDNDNIKSDFWEIRKIEGLNTNKAKENRIYKILPHIYLSQYDYSLYIDGNFRIIGDIEQYITKFSKDNAMICFIHPDRNCIYEEAKACISLKKDSETVIKNQIEKYKSENYPKDHGLIASGILFRKHNDPYVIQAMDLWWNEVKSHSHRDQLSFNYICWKNDFKYDKCNLSIWGNEYFEHFLTKFNEFCEFHLSNKVFHYRHICIFAK